MSKTLKEKRALWWWRRVLVGLVLAAVLLPAVFILVSYLIERQVGAEIVKVSRLGEPITFADLKAGVSQGDTDEDAASYYNEVLLGIVPEGLEKLIRTDAFYRESINSLGVSDFPDELSERLTQTLLPFRAILRNLDKGAGVGLFSPVVSVEWGMQVCRERLRRVQMAALLLSLRTFELILHGEDDAAANSVISTLKLARVFDYQPTIVVHAVKAGVIDLACEDIYLLLKRGQPAGKSLARLQKALSEAVPANALEKMFLAERVYQIEMARNLLPEDIALQFLQDEIPALPERLVLPESFRVRLRIRQKAIRYFHDMSRLIAVVRRPWPEPLDETAKDLTRPAEKSDRLISSGARFIHFTAKTFASTRCTILVIAVERYQRSHGELPRSLDDVSGTYIDSIPLDPFTGKKLLYSYDEENYVVYSVGINRRDDKGSVGQQPTEKGPQDIGLSIAFHEPQ